MRTMNLKIKSYAEAISIVDTDNLQKRTLHFLITSFGILGVCYILILGSMVFNIVERRALEEGARTLSTEVGDLELSYLDASSDIDLELSHSLGFKETNIKFATRKTLGSIKLAQNEI